MNPPPNITRVIRDNDRVASYTNLYHKDVSQLNHNKWYHGTSKKRLMSPSHASHRNNAEDPSSSVRERRERLRQLYLEEEERFQEELEAQGLSILKSKDE